MAVARSEISAAIVLDVVGLRANEGDCGGVNNGGVKLGILLPNEATSFSIARKSRKGKVSTL